MTTVADAIKAELDGFDWGTQPPDGYDVTVPDSPARRYWVLFPDAGSRKALSLCGDQSDDLRFTFQVTSVGGTRAEVEWIQQRVQQLADLRLTVGGLSLNPISHDGSRPIRPDDRIPDRVVLYGVDQFSITGTSS